MVVQLFVTVSLITSTFGQLIGIALLVRCPIEWILRFEHPIVTITMALNAITGKSRNSRNFLSLIFYVKSILI